MAADTNAYAILGLEPGADAEAIDRAYRRLIKEFHPDRAGGNATRAAEINHAYRELRGGKARDWPVWADEQSLALTGRRGAWVRGGAVGAVAIAAAILLTGPMMKLADQLSVVPLAGLKEKAPPKPGPDAMDRPLNLSAIDEAIANSVWISSHQDEMALARESARCNRALRKEPSFEQFDRCAAFDDAVQQLQDRDPLRDEGPFSELAVSGRQMSAATSLSTDYLSIDGRLSRIRLRVELALAPPPPAPVAVKRDVAD